MTIDSQDGLITFSESKGKRAVTSNRVITGLAASRGTVVGQTVKISERSDARRVQRGNILVTTMTTPEHLDAMYRSGGCITSTGGITCHAAIIMREMGKPAVIAAGTEVLDLPDGTWVKLDGGAGTIEVLPD